MIVLNIWLHGKPNWALPLEGQEYVSPAYVRQYGNELKAHLYSVASVVQKLQCNGWKMLKSFGTLYNLEYSKEGVSMDNVDDELEKLGIKVGGFIGVEDLNVEACY